MLAVTSPPLGNSPATHRQYAAVFGGIALAEQALPIDGMLHAFSVASFLLLNEVVLFASMTSGYILVTSVALSS